MPVLASVNSVFRNLLRKQRVEQDLDDEMRSHLDLLTDEKIRHGMKPQEAARAARLELGGVEQIKERVRETRAGVWLETVWQDLRVGVRLLRKEPGFATVAVLTLALGIGANTAVFSVVNAVLLKPVSAPEPDRVVVFMDTNPTGSTSLASEIKFNVWIEQTGILQDVSAYRPGSLNLTGVDQPQKAYAIFVTENYFHLFGIRLAEGRSFASDEEQPNGASVVVLSDAFWKRAFGGDPHIVSKTISLNGSDYQVIGILARDTRTESLGPTNGPSLPESVPDVWLPFPIASNSSNQNHYFQAVGRLKPGVTLDSANAQLLLATQEFRRKFPTGLSTSRGDVFSVEPLRDLLVKRVRFSLLVLTGAVGFVLLIACANVASLLLARAVGRTHEIAVRSALGASRGRIIRQLLTESVVLSVGGAMVGVGLGLTGIRTLLALNPYDIPRIGINASNVALDWRILICTALVALIAGVLFGLLPALSASRTNLIENLQECGDRSGTSVRHRTALSFLVIGETCVAVVLLIGAVLLIRALIAVRSVNPGFDPHNVVTVHTTLDPHLAKVSTNNQIVEVAIRGLTALPGVEAAASANVLPLEGLFSSLPITVVGRPVAGPSPVAGHGNSHFMTISPGYFDVLKVPLIRGRLLTETDQIGAPGVAVINQAMARRFWPDDDPLSAQILIGQGVGPNTNEPPRQIVGIVADVHDDELDVNPEPAVYVPIAQRLAGGTQTTTLDRTWIIRVREKSPLLDSAIQNELRQAIGGLPVPPLRSMEEVTVRSTARQDFNMRLLTSFGCAALLIAAIGIYGLTAHTVQQRTREIAIRAAIGAQRREILTMVIGGAMKLALLGACIGVAAALGLTRFLTSFLFGVRPNDPVTFAMVAFTLLVAALLACYIPAWRATKVDPAVALRHQ